MLLETITMEKDEAAERLEAYRQALERHDDPVYEEIATALHWLQRDEVLGLIDLRAAISAGGVDREGLPRLAVMRADREWCWLGRRGRDGSVQFWLEREPHHNRKSGLYRFPAGTLPVLTNPELEVRLTRWGRDPARRAMVPLVPPELRPTHHLRNYEVLWEVDRWEYDPEPPTDPALLKHMGGDLYALLGVWDLTDLERAVLAGRREG